MWNRTVVFVIALITIFGLSGVVFAAPTSQKLRTILPETDLTYDLGTSSLRWNYGAFNNLTISGTCTGCGTTSTSPWTRASTFVYLATSTDWVGIGTNVPSSTLHLFDPEALLTITGRSATSVIGLNIGSAGVPRINFTVDGGDSSAAFEALGPSTDETVAFLVDNGVANLTLNDNAGLPVVILTTASASPSYVVANGGKFGVGTINPSTTLHVTGGAGTFSAALTGTSTLNWGGNLNTTGTATFQLRSTHNSGITGTSTLLWGGNANTTGTLRVNLGTTLASTLTQSGGVVSLASTTITGQATTTNLSVTSVTNALHVGSSVGLVSAYGGTSCSASNYPTGLSATGTFTGCTAAAAGGSGMEMSFRMNSSNYAAPSSSFAGITKIYGTTRTYETLSYVTASDSSAQFSFVVPEAATTSTFTISWTASSTATGTVMWYVDMRAVGDGAVIDAAGTVTTSSDTYATTTSKVLHTTSFNVTGRPTIAAGDTMFVTIMRDVSEDMLAVDALLVEAILQIE